MAIGLRLLRSGGLLVSFSKSIKLPVLRCRGNPLNHWIDHVRIRRQSLWTLCYHGCVHPKCCLCLLLSPMGYRVVLMKCQRRKVLSTRWRKCLINSRSRSNNVWLPVLNNCKNYSRSWLQQFLTSFNCWKGQRVCDLGWISKDHKCTT